jgi:beta-glucosidase
MATDRPERHAKQLAGHWARKGSAGDEDGVTVIRFGQREELDVVWDAAPAEAEEPAEAAAPAEAEEL